MKRINELQSLTLKEDFWNDRTTAQNILKEITGYKYWVEEIEKIEAGFEELKGLFDLALEEEEDAIYDVIEEELKNIENSLKELELKKMLGDEDDNKNAILTIHPGAGGTESQDWAEMLMRMYLRWIEKKGYSYTLMDLQTENEAGIKSATIEIKGDFAYGFAKAENGVHRLVRISPFDSNHRRHTSFASVFVYPEIDENVEIEVDIADLKIDTYRASGAGGQHVNKTDSAVRITHIPSGIVVQCQNERSQHKNKANALKVLKSRLYKLRKEEEEKEKKKLEKTKKEIAWGSQIRSYIMHPYNLVKDHRTGTETSDVQSVMNGSIDKFIEDFLIS